MDAELLKKLSQRKLTEEEVSGGAEQDQNIPTWLTEEEEKEGKNDANNNDNEENNGSTAAKKRPSKLSMAVAKAQQHRVSPLPTTAAVDTTSNELQEKPSHYPWRTNNSSNVSSSNNDDNIESGSDININEDWYKTSTNHNDNDNVEEEDMLDMSDVGDQEEEDDIDLDRESIESDGDYYQQDYNFILGGSQRQLHLQEPEIENFVEGNTASSTNSLSPDAIDMTAMMSSLPADILADMEAAKEMLYGSTGVDNTTEKEEGYQEGALPADILADMEAAKEMLYGSTGVDNTTEKEGGDQEGGNDREYSPSPSNKPEGDKWSPFPSSRPPTASTTLTSHDDDEVDFDTNDGGASNKKLSHQGLASSANNTAPFTPDKNQHNSMMSNIQQKLAATQSIDTDDGASSPLAVSLSGSTGGGAPPEIVKRIIHDNQKLRKRKKELLTLLSSTAQQFSSYEKVCSQKICKLEEENKRLVKKRSPRRINREFQLAKAAHQEIGELLANKSSVKMYDGEVVRKLSNGVLKQEKQLESKDELITQLKLRCEVLKQSLLDRDGEILQEKKLWVEERSKMLSRLDGSSPSKQNHGELLSKKMEVIRLKKELETALSDITMLTDSLETNNIALDSAVLGLDKLKVEKKAWKNGTVSSETVEKMEMELKEKTNETAQLQKDLESALNDIEQLRESLRSAGSAKGYDDFQNVVEDLRIESKRYKKEADTAKVELSQMKADFETNKSELTKLRVELIHAGVTEEEDENDDTSSPADNIAEALTNGIPNLPPLGRQGSGRKNLLNNIRLGFGKPGPEESANLQTMVRQRDLKIKSLEAMVHSNTRIIQKMKNDIERMDNENEEAEHMAKQKIGELTEQNTTYGMQVEGYEKTFMNMNERSISGGHVAMGKSLSDAFKQDNGDIVDDNMFMSDDEPDPEDSGGENNELVKELQERNMDLERILSELQSSSSNQEDQIETLRAEMMKLRVKSQLEKDSAVAHLTEENKIVIAQRFALESQLAEINKTAGNMRNSSSSTGEGGDKDTSGSDPMLVARNAMLENAKKVLESSVESLRGDMQEKLAPMLDRIALVESEKECIEEEMATKIELKDMTIANLESSLQQLQQHAKSPKRRASKRAAKEEKEEV